MAIRKSAQARTETLNGTTAGVAQGFVYIGFPKGGVDPTQDVLAEVCYVANGAIAGTSIRLVQFSAAGVVKNDITTPVVTTVVGAAIDATLATNTVNTGVNFPWPLTAGDSIVLTAVTGVAQSVSVTGTIYPKGT
jgi:hypothetical protein